MPLDISSKWTTTDKQGFLNLMDGDGNSKDDVKIPDTDLGKEIENAFNDGKDAMVTIIAAMGMSISSRIHETY